MIDGKIKCMKRILTFEWPYGYSVKLQCIVERLQEIISTYSSLVTLHFVPSFQMLNQDCLGQKTASYVL